MGTTTINMEAPTVGPVEQHDTDWRSDVWNILCHHQRADGECPRFCVDDHLDHVHMLFKCGCPRKCPTRNYRINCTVEMLCDVVPEENMHIHVYAPTETPTLPDAIAGLKTSTFDGSAHEDE